MIATNLAGFEKLPQTLPHYCLESFRQNNNPDALALRQAIPVLTFGHKFVGTSGARVGWLATSLFLPKCRCVAKSAKLSALRIRIG
jgi:hypothetical protein